MALISKERKITPAMAKVYLEANTKNRPLSKRAVDFLKKEILAGRWKSTGDPIKFSKNGRLLDGQHRLTAIAESGITVLSYVIEGLEEDVFNVLDTGNKRDAKDVLSLSGVKHSLYMAATIRNILIVNDLGFHKAVNKERGFTQRIKFSIEEIMDFYTKNKTIEKEIEFIVDGCHLFGHIGVALLATAYHSMKKIDQKFAQHFFERYFNGDSLNKTSPIFILRTKLMQDVKGKLCNRDKLILLVMAWNLCRQKKGCNILTVPKNATVPEII